MAPHRSIALLLVAGCVGTVQALETRASLNPIRKVVNMLQMMQKKVEEEGASAEVLFQKYMCYCKTSGGALSESIEAAKAKVPDLVAGIKAAEGKLVQLKKDVKEHHADRTSAQAAIEEATGIRAKEAAAFGKEVAESKADIAALKKAIAALERGMFGGFLQTSAVAVVRKLVSQSKEMLDADQKEVLSFLSGQQGDGYAPASGEIVGILKQMLDEMVKDYKDTVATERNAMKDFEGLVASKKKEAAVSSKSIEVKLQRSADLGVQIATMKNDLGDTSEALDEDKAFLADMEKNCASKGKLHEEEKNMRAQEVVALADTIKILNDDDALDLFKATLPGPAASFFQLQVTASSMRAQARAILAQARARARPSQRQRLDFVALALHGKRVGFEKIIKLVDELVATLDKEQSDDDDKKSYCAQQLDETDDKRKGLERSIADLQTVIAESKEGTAILSDEIKALEVGIKALDKSVAEATGQRKMENKEFKDLMSSNSAAKELLLFAKNRLMKFYNPKLHKAPKKQELSEEDRIYVNEGGAITTEAPGGIAGIGIKAFTQLSAKVRREAGAPPPPPETADAYTKKSEENAGVLAMVDLLVRDLDKEMTIAEAEEKNAQQDYEMTMADSAKKRAEDAKLISDKSAAKAGLESSQQESRAEKKSTEKELKATVQFTQSLHADCDWLMQYYIVRKEARADEVDSLQKARAVLSGADYSLVQIGSSRRVRTHLRRAQ